ncbi:MAG: cytochrome c biogenesis protein CcsA, partial [Xanthomonadales bacterium]|nr:cytochrome c biogenesis protein CcsA [Xanthomonadales bacterium]
GALLHAWLQARAWSHMPLGGVDIATVLSLCSLVVVALWASTLWRPDAVPESGLIALPLAAVANVIDALVSGPYLDEGVSLSGAPPGTVVHIVSSVIAFGMLSLAGTYAILVLAIDHSLKRHHLSRLVQQLPPLDQLEGLLFKLIATGFAILTLSLASGLIFVQNLMAQHLVHKTTIAFMAWLVFGALLLGRWRWGWRGARAVRLTLAGVALLLLSYFGSKLVLEVILGRSWHS